MKKIIIGIFLMASLYASDQKQKRQKLKDYFARRPVSEPLKLQNLKMTQEDCANLSEMLEKLSVKVVILDNSTFGDNGKDFRTFVAAFCTMPQLKRLSLYNVGITDKDFEELSMQLKKRSNPNTFKYLDIRSNKLGPTALKQVIELLQVHKQLTVLDDFCSDAYFTLLKELRIEG